MKEFNGTSFYEYLDESKLMGSRCESCNALYVPPRPLCPSCHGDAMVWEEMSGEGQLMAFTTVHIAPTAMIEAGYGRDNPYCVGIVELAEGPAISAQIVGMDPAKPKSIEIGARLQATYVERGDRSFLGFEPAA
jgi:uncharacterized OB-fold protein